MIGYLAVRDFKLADFVEIEFDPGFTVLTGETGAGKSLIVDALGLLLGDRASTEVIAADAERAEIHAALELPPEHPAHLWLQERELDADGECVLRRVLARRSSQSRAYVNGKPVTVQDLKALGELLVDIHGQHEHQHLADRERQRQIVDACAGIERQVDELARDFRRLQELQERLRRIDERSEADRQRAHLLEFQVKELRALAPVEGRQAHAQDLLQGVDRLVNMLADADEDSISERLGRAGHILAELTAHDPELAEAASRIESLAIEVDDLAGDLRSRLDGYEFDPAEFERLQKRLDALHGAGRKYRVDIDDLAGLLTRLQEELSGLAVSDQDREALAREIDAAAAAWDKAAAAVSAARRDAAAELGKRVVAELAGLGMSGARFEVALVAVDGRRARGAETVEFRIATNSRQQPGPLARVASGGELSRVALAINVASHQGAAAVTQVYDEVDVGIGGRVAEMVGQKLRQLAAARQVLCVTHLPQVASQAVSHRRVVKSDGDDTRVRIEALDADGRTREIARMLGGIEITERTLEHAGEMLRQADR